MQTKTNRRGLALGAIFALVGSLFAVTPASYAVTDGESIAIRPLSNAGLTTFGGLITEDFPVYAQLKSGVSNANFATGNVLFEITHVSGASPIFAVATSHSATVGGSNTGIADPTAIASLSESVSGVAQTGISGTVSSIATASHTTSYGVGNTTVTMSAKVNSSGVAPLFLRPLSTSAFTSKSTTVVYDVKVFIDDLGGSNGRYDVGEWFTTQRVTFYATGNVSPTLTVGSPAKGDTVVTASATLATLNWSNLNGRAYLQVSSSDVVGATFSGAIHYSASPTISSAVATARSGVFSHSFAVSSLTESTTISAALWYAADGAVTGSNGVRLATLEEAVVSAPVANTLSISSVVSAMNVTGGGTAYSIRQNQNLTVVVSVTTNSTSVSGAVVTLTTGGTALATSSKTLTINGGSLMTTHGTVTATSNAHGFATFTIAPSGYVDTNTITLKASIDNVESTTVTLTNADPTYTVTADYDRYLTAPGTAVTLGFTVKDQYNKPYAGSDGYIKATRGGTGFAYATTISYHPVTAVTGVSAISFTPEAATTTGSATVEADFVRSINGAYVDSGTDADVTVNVTSAASTFGTGLAASYSSSVSYFPSTVSWTTVTGKVTNTGSAVVVSGTDLIFRASSTLTTTYSGGITVRASDALSYTFDVASLKAGSHTMSLTNGSGATTSLLVVSGAAYTSAATITFDTTTITAGRTKVVTGQVLDANGNGVYSAGTASLTVTYTGTAGIPVGSMPTTTDVNGKFVISILTSAADSGNFTLTAVYAKDGASTAAADKISAVQVITVGSGAASADQKVNAGSFKGYVAVYAKGYAGQRMSAKVGNDWVVVESLASNFVRVVEYTGAGYTIAVRIYIDRVLVDTITVTTK